MVSSEVADKDRFLNGKLVKITRMAVPDAVLEQVKKLILNQSFQMGDKLPSERVLAEQSGVSRPSLREAFKTLEALGIVEIKHGSGIYVKEPSLDFATFPITVMMSRDQNIVEELIEARQIVEVEVVALAARKATPERLKDLEKFIEERSRPEEANRLEGKFDFEFEKLIAQAVENRILMSIQEATHTLWGIGLKKVGFKPLPVEIVNEEHRRIFLAIQSRDENLARLEMIHHLQAPLRMISQKPQQEL